jgi:hypothetical protein
VIFLFSGILLAVVALPVLLWPADVWGVLAFLQYRTADAVEPSQRRLRLFRMAAAMTLTAGLALVLGFFWPGTVTAKGTAALVLGLTCYAIIVVVTVVVRARAARRAATVSDEQRYSEEDHLPPDEPSEFAYGFDYLRLVIFGFVFFTICGIVISTGDWTP